MRRGCYFPEAHLVADIGKCVAFAFTNTKDHNCKWLRCFVAVYNIKR